MRVQILQSKFLTAGVVQNLNALYGELRVTAHKQPTMSQWKRIVAQKDARVFVAWERGKAVGMTTLRWHDLIPGRVGAIEDVVVSADSRGKGYGARLTETAIFFAKKKKIVYIDLTSRPERKAASKLYQKFGWKKRRTNVYRLQITQHVFDSEG